MRNVIALHIIALGTCLARLDRVYEASERSGKPSEIGKLSIRNVIPHS